MLGAWSNALESIHGDAIPVRCVMYLLGAELLRQTRSVLTVLLLRA
jgi:hypothetical protein